MINCKSEIIAARFVPMNEETVKSIPNLTIGNSMGKESTGNNACLELALEIIAEITVVVVATAIDEIAITKTIIPGDFTIPEFEKRKNKISEKKLMNKLSNTLKINLPK